MLLLPSVNIEMGCWYLRYLFDSFEVQEVVWAAYNAGHGRVRNWLADSQYSSDGKTLGTIPYKETKEYVQKMGKVYAAYRKLYET